MTEKRTGALVLIAIGVLFLLINSGIFSFADLGEFFGNMGGGIGEFFGSFGRSIGDLWPLALIGVALLFWRRPSGREGA